jgi:hypothetical protein
MSFGKIILLSAAGAMGMMALAALLQIDIPGQGRASSTVLAGFGLICWFAIFQFLAALRRKGTRA